MAFVLQELLRLMVERGGSDLHLKVGTPPAMRLNGVLFRLSRQTVSPEDMKNLLRSALDRPKLKTLVERGDVDALYVLEGVGRFRISAYRQMGSMAMVLRHIPFEVPDIESLGLPPILKDIASTPRGIVLVTGTTGSGKTTTLAAMIEHINRTRPVTVVTVEDPVEYVHSDKKAMIYQRSLGDDVPTFEQALKHVLRQDPDVILIGEMRDRETMQTAVTAAETGHLVFSTLHTTDCSQTVERILNTYPAEQQEQIRMQLSLNLRAVLSQRLVPCRKGGRVPAVEILISTPTVRKLIREGEVHKLYGVMKDGRTEGMQTFNQVLLEYFRDGVITRDAALEAASRPEELELALKLEGDTGWSSAQ